MAPVRPVSVLALAKADLVTLPRNLFGLGAVTVFLAFLAFVQTVALLGPTALRDVLMFMLVVAQFLVAVVLAARVAAARRTRFVDSLFTTPLGQRTWLLAQAVVGLALAGALFVVHIPVIVVTMAYLGVPHMLWPTLGAGAAMAVFAVALGLFCGVIVGQAGGGAAAGLAGGFGFLSFVGLIVHGAFATDPTAATIARIAAVSPLTLVVEAFGVDIWGFVPAEPWLALLGFASITLGLAGAAWLAATRHQSPLGWEPRGKGARLGLAVLVAVSLAAPAALATTAFQDIDAPQSWIREPGEFTRIAVVERGTPISDDQFTYDFSYGWSPLRFGQDNEVDALVMLLVPADAAIRAVEVKVSAVEDITLVSGGRETIADGQPDGRARTEMTAGDPDALHPVYRIPMTLRPNNADALLGSVSVLQIDTRYQDDGRPYTSKAEMSIHSDVPTARPVLLAAALPPPFLALAGIVVRRIKTR